MSFAIILIVSLLAIGVSNRNPVHPATAGLLLQTESEAIDCRPAGVPDSVLDQEKPNRVSHFRVSGEFECRRPVFTRDERDPVFDRALQAVIEDSRRVAEIVRSKLTDESASISVSVTGDYPAEFRERVALIYRNELLTSLGSGRVVRDRASESAELSVDLQRADHPDLVTHARLRLPARQKSEGASWQNL